MTLVRLLVAAALVGRMGEALFPQLRPKPDPAMLDLKLIAQALAPSLDKDERRIRLFVAAAEKRAVELSLYAATYPSLSAAAKVGEFAKASGELLAKWVLRAKKIGLRDVPAILSGRFDPYKELREETRRFAAAWGLDEALRAELG